MIGVGETFPTYSLTATVSRDIKKAFKTITDQDYKGKWKVYFFWPKDFTFVCPTEIAAFGKLKQGVRGSRRADPGRQHRFANSSIIAWRTNHEDLKDLPFPMLADIKRELCHRIRHPRSQEGVAQRATFIVDPREHHPFRLCHRLSVGRNPQEVLRVLDALQTDELCPCNWQKGEETLVIA